MGKGNEKEEYADWSEEERTVHWLRDGLRETVAEGSFGAGYLKRASRISRGGFRYRTMRDTRWIYFVEQRWYRVYTRPLRFVKGVFYSFTMFYYIEESKVRGVLIRGGNNE